MRYEFEPTEADRGGAERGMALAVRIAGLVLLAAGMWVLVAVLIEAWALYHDPGRLQPLAQAIERAGIAGANAADGAAALEPLAAPASPPAAAIGGLSYVAAWPVALLTLLLAGHLALGAIRTGGALALGGVRRRREG